jgi:hypothetical protein
MMTKRSVALVGVLLIMAMIGSSVLGAVSAIAASDTANGSFSIFLPLILNAIGAMAEVPQGAVMTFNLASCPSGWTELTLAQGRTIVGLPSGGTLSGTVGSSLGNLENRSHSHSINPPHTVTSSNGTHNHTIDPPASNTEYAGNHDHIWGWVDTDEKFYTYDGTGTSILMHNWVDGLPTSDSYNSSGTSVYIPVGPDFIASGSGDLVPSNEFYWTQNAPNHRHSYNLPPFPTVFAGTHAHTVDISTFNSDNKTTGDVMPYIQFLVCEKD